MKKLVTLFVVSVVVTGTTFAQLSVRGSAYAFWDTFQHVSPARDGKDDLWLSGIGRPGGSSMETILDFTGQLESRVAGFKVQLSYQGATTLASGENVLAWVKPFDWLRLDIGKMKVDDMRGKLPVWYFPVLDGFMLKAGRDNDIFTNYEANNSVLFRLTPIENLFIGMFLYNQALLGQGENAASGPLIGGENPENAFKRIQTTAAWTFPDIGLARLQYYGVNPDINTDTLLITAPRLEAAFSFTGIDGLIVDLGGKYSFLLNDPQVPARRNIYTGGGRIPIPALPANSAGEDAKTGTVERPGTFQAPQQVSLAARYEMHNIGPGTLTLQGRADSKFWGYYQLPGENITRIGPEIKASIWPSYRLGNWTFQVESTLVYAADWTKYGKTILTGGLGYSFSGFVQRNFAGGTSILIGIAYAGGEGIVLPKMGANAGGTALTVHDELARLSTSTTAGKLPSVFSVPVKFSFYF
jgi:hypothetical protein